MSRKVLLQLVLPLIGLSVLFWLLAFAPGDKHHQPALLEMSVILRDGDGNVSAMRKGMEQAAKDLNVELSITLDPKDIEDCDGVIFPGGLPDVDPELYGEENQGSMNLDRTLDDEQMAMIDAAVKAKKPILAICRGMQLVNVYFGGTLIQDLENGTMHKYVPNENKLHDTVCISGTPFAIIYGDTGIVNSAHHQAVKKLGKGFKIGQVWLSGKLSPEQKKEWLEKIENDENLEIECKRTCIIEGMIHKELPIIMVQWHPELMHRDPIKGTLDQDRIFMYFASLLK